MSTLSFLDKPFIASVDVDGPFLTVNPSTFTYPVLFNSLTDVVLLELFVLFSEVVSFVVLALVSVVSLLFDVP